MKRVALLTILLLSVVSGFTAFSGEKVYACSCVGGDALEKLERSAAVFEGKVIKKGGRSIFSSTELREYTFEVNKTWKGVHNPSITVFSIDAGSESCGFEFAKNETYLVYASGDKKDNTLQTSLCNGNKPISQATGDLQLLGAGQTIDKENSEKFAVNRSSPFTLILYVAVVPLVILFVILWIWRKKKRSRS